MRYLTAELKRAFSEESKMVFITGPRQVGKTTLAKHLLAQAHSESFYFNWDVQSHRKAIIKNPEDFWRNEEYSSDASKPHICLDEIHKYPRWKRFLKGLYDLRSNEVQIIVTGSGRLDVYQRGGDSLVGRYNLYHLYPFTLGEILQADHQTILTPAEFWKKVESNDTPPSAENVSRNWKR